MELTRRSFAAAAAGSTLFFGASRFATLAWGDGSFTPGTYTGSAKGKSGNIVIECTFGDSAIEAIEVTEKHEHPVISAAAFERIPAEVIEYQTLDIDAVAGATLTSYALLSALADCVEAAGAEDLTGEAPAVAHTDETIDCDLVVVGAGAAGCSAAVVAAQQGYNVVLLEAASNIGGNCLVSGGLLENIFAPDELKADITEGYIAAAEKILENPPIESEWEQEIVDTARQQWAEYLASGETKCFDSIEFFAVHYQSFRGDTIANQYLVGKNRADITNWLLDLGLEFTPCVSIVGSMWPRWCRPSTGAGGEGYFNLFTKVMEEQNLPVELLIETRATKLIGEPGKVTGVMAECGATDTTYTINSKMGVILATGGFSGNTEMLKEYNTYWDFDACDIIPTTNCGFHYGDAITMAKEFGAAVKGAGNPMMFPLANPQNGTMEYMVGNSGNFCYVNKDGNRFVNESLDRFSLSKAMMANGNVCYMISGTNNVPEMASGMKNGVPVSWLIEQGHLFMGETLEELAANAGINAENLVATVAKYNEYAQNFNDTDFGRTAFNEKSPILDGPFYACPRTWAAHLVEGGIQTADHFVDYHVLTEDGAPIEGLYAAGEVRNLIAGVGSIGDGYSCAMSIVG